jgi:hypothetical protein
LSLTSLILLKFILLVHKLLCFTNEFSYVLIASFHSGQLFLCWHSWMDLDSRSLLFFFYQISSYYTCKYLINNNFILIIFLSYNDITYRNFYIPSIYIIFSIFIRYLFHYWSCFFRYVHNLFLCYDLFKGINNYINANFFILLLFLS